MEEQYDRPISRRDLLFTVEMALKKARRFWPRRERPGDYDRFRPLAEAIVAHLELCGIRCFGKAPAPDHSTSGPLAAGSGKRKPAGEDGE